MIASATKYYYYNYYIQPSICKHILVGPNIIITYYIDTITAMDADANNKYEFNVRFRPDRFRWTFFILITGKFFEFYISMNFGRSPKEMILALR